MSNPNASASFGYTGDFREPAAYESQRLITENRGFVPPGCSLCLPTGADPAVMRGYGRWVLVRLLLGIAGIAGGGVIAAALGKRDHSAMFIALAASASIGGIIVLLSNNFFTARFTRRHLGQRWHDLLALPRDGRPKCVGIEDAHSFSKMKITPEDFGYLIIDSSSHTVTIEGVLYRYIVHGDDVLNIEQRRGTTASAPAINFAVGRAELSIALQDVSLSREFKKQTVGIKHDPLLTSLRNALAHDELEVLD